MATWKEAAAKARELGAEIDNSINWSWAKGFRSPEAGAEFVAWCDANGIEHHGYIPACPDSPNLNWHTDGVRFR